MDILESLLPYKLDLYVQFDKQDPNTGAIQKEWDYSKTLDCSAKGMVSNSTSTRTNDRQQLDNRYINNQLIQIRCAEKIN